jgi:hypothetical protein
MPSATLSQVGQIVTGINQAGESGVFDAFYIQIKDLDLEKRALVAGPTPRVKRAIAVAEGDLLLAARGERPAVALADPGLFGAYPTLDVYLIRPDTARLDPAYLAAYLAQEHVIGQLRASTVGVLIPRIPKADLDDLPIPLPPLERQRAIGALAQTVQRERRLLDRLTAAHRHLRERQLAVAFSALK